MLEVDTVTNLHWGKGCNQAVTFDLEKEKVKDFFEKFQDHPAGDDMGFDVSLIWTILYGHYDMRCEKKEIRIKSIFYYLNEMARKTCPSL